MVNAIYWYQLNSMSHLQNLLWQLFVKLPSGKTVTLDLIHCDTVKEAIKDTQGIPVEATRPQWKTASG